MPEIITSIATEILQNNLSRERKPIPDLHVKVTRE